jgi:hypothetical protein
VLSKIARVLLVSDSSRFTDEVVVGGYRLATLRLGPPIRRSFLHPVDDGAGPLARFVRQRRATALDLLLLTHAIRPLTPVGEIVAPSSDWARSLGIYDKAGARAAISRSWSWLQQEQFVATRRVGKQVAVRLLREDGSGLPWIHPYETKEPYFRLPKLIWTTGLWQSLQLPGKAMLLIAYSLQTPEQEFFEFPVERGADWYGLGSRTVRAGLNQLVDAGVLRHWSVRRDSSSPIGYRYDRRYALNTWNISQWEPARNSQTEFWPGSE